MKSYRPQSAPHFVVVDSGHQFQVHFVLCNVNPIDLKIKFEDYRNYMLVFRMKNRDKCMLASIKMYKNFSSYANFDT